MSWHDLLYKISHWKQCIMEMHRTCIFSCNLVWIVDDLQVLISQKCFSIYVSRLWFESYRFWFVLPESNLPTIEWSFFLFIWLTKWPWGRVLAGFQNPGLEIRISEQSAQFWPNFAGSCARSMFLWQTQAWWAALQAQWAALRAQICAFAPVISRPDPTQQRRFQNNRLKHSVAIQQHSQTKKWLLVTGK